MNSKTNIFQNLHQMELC